MSKNIESTSTVSDVDSSIVTEGVVERKEPVALLPRIIDLPSPTNFRAWTNAVNHNADALKSIGFYKALSDAQLFYAFEDTTLSDGALTQGKRATRSPHEYHSVAIIAEVERRGWIDGNGDATDKYANVSALFEPIPDDEDEENN